MNDIYEQEDIFYIHSPKYAFVEKITLVTFNDGRQWCSHCGQDSADKFNRQEMAGFRAWRDSQ